MPDPFDHALQEHRKREAYARKSDPSTSHAAAESLDEETLSELMSMVYSAIKASPNGMTAEEASDHIGIDKQSITPRFRPLVERGFIEMRVRDGEPIKRKNRSGRSAIVWFERN